MSLLNSQLKEELGQARDKIKEQAEEIAELYDFQDELEQYTRKNSVEICGIPESAYESTEKAVLKIYEALNVAISPEDIEITHHLNRKGVEKRIRPIIVKFISHKVKSKLYKSRAKLKGAVSLVFCVTLDRQKTYLNRWNRQNNGLVLLPITLLVHRN